MNACAHVRAHVARSCLSIFCSFLCGFMFNIFVWTWICTLTIRISGYKLQSVPVSRHTRIYTRIRIYTNRLTYTYTHSYKQTYIYIYIYIYICTWQCQPNLAEAVEYTDCISARVMLELRGMRSTLSLPSLPGPVWPGGIKPDRILSMGQKELFDM